MSQVVTTPDGRADAARGDVAAGAHRTVGATLRPWGYAFAAYTGFLILNCTSNAVYGATHGIRVNWPNLIGYRVVEDYTCALFVVPLFWLVHRFPVSRRTWRRHIPILLAAVLAFIAIKYLVIIRLLVTLLPPARAVFHPDPGGWLSTTATNTASVFIDFVGVVIAAHAWEYYRRAQERERVATQLRAQLSEAQLQALRSQLHPHFLFNTLNGVATLMHRDVLGADKMVTDLADLLRATLQHPGTHEIPLAEELALLERYLGIIGVRFRDRLTVAYEIAPDVRDALVPQFLLQPLAENAIEHGIAQRPGRGTLVIGAVRSNDQVWVTVCDDGPGLRSDGPLGHGVGLANTRARLRELYGAEQDLRLEPASSAGGVRVRVMLPYRRRATLRWQPPTGELV